MTQLLNFTNDIKKYIDPFLSKECFLYFMGGIFLLGIVAQWVSSVVYGSLIRKAKNMVSTRNKTLKQIKMRFENSRAINGMVANSTLMVEKYINRYKFMGIKLGNITKITYRCAMIALFASGVTGCFLYETHHDKVQIFSYVAVGCFVAFGLDIYARSVKLEQKESELICVITDFLENTVDATVRRKERAAIENKVAKAQGEAEKQNGENNNNNVESDSKLEVLSTDLEEEELKIREEISKNKLNERKEMEEMERQEKIIREFLYEYFAN